MRLLLVLGSLALIAFVAVSHVRAAADQRRLASIAGELAGRDVSIHCQTLVGELVNVADRHGSVEFDADGRPSDVAKLDRATCKALVRLAHGRPDSVVRAATAVEVLAHESYHLAGVEDEAATECYAIQAISFVARRLGASPERAATLAAYILERYATLPEEYRSDECRDGGRLDLRPEVVSWPS